jgi:Flp pilus assembly pilin Flp
MAHPHANDNLSAQETTMAIILSRLNNLRKDQRGQDMTEYALIAGMMASMVVAVVPPMMSIAMHIVTLLQDVAQIAMHAASLD